jgi:iron uptake system EfeUOB component EfeO/EfeM
MMAEIDRMCFELATFVLSDEASDEDKRRTAEDIQTLAEDLCKIRLHEERRCAIGEIDQMRFELAGFVLGDDASDGDKRQTADDIQKLAEDFHSIRLQRKRERHVTK